LQLESAKTEGGLEGGNPGRFAEIKERFTYRMHDLGQFMKGLLQRFPQWFNARHKRTRTLWEQRFKSVIVESGDNQTVLPELSMAMMLRCRVRYFTDGTVIGSREFVDGAFEGARERFSEKSKDGASRLRGNAEAAAGVLWSVRDLPVGFSVPNAREMLGGKPFGQSLDINANDC